MEHIRFQVGKIILLSCLDLGIFIRYTFLSNRNIHKSSYDLCFWASDPLIDRFYENLMIKGSGAQKKRPCELL